MTGYEIIRKTRFPALDRNKKTYYNSFENMQNKYQKFQPRNPYGGTRVNEQIRVPEVRVIDAEGNQLGIMPTHEAIASSKELGLDLVEVSPKAQPPVVKMINYDKYRYQQNKLQQAQRKHQKTIEVKGIRLSARTGIHDMEFKARAAEKFLKAGNKIKIDLMLRGREKANVEYAIEQVKKFLSLIAIPHLVEMQPRRMGNMINTFLAPK